MATANLSVDNLSFNKALLVLNGKKEKKIGQNTWLIMEYNGDVAVKYHATNIVTFHPNGSITLKTGGWDTVTTRGRLNDLVEFSIFKEKGETLIKDREGTYYSFREVTEISPDGYILNQTPVFADKLGEFLNMKFSTMAEVIKTVKELSVDQMEKVWKKFIKDRSFLATHCVDVFLPLALANNKTGEEKWMKIVRDRLSSIKAVA